MVLNKIARFPFSTRSLFAKYYTIFNHRQVVLLKTSFQRFVSNNSFKGTQITRNNAEEILSGYDTVLLDCDGVLWRTDCNTSIPGIPETIRKLRDLGKHVLFVTNNSRLSRNMCTQKFIKFGIEPGVTDDLFCVAYAVAIYLRDVLNVTGSVYNIGSFGMERELALAGLDNFGAGQDCDIPTQNITDLLNMSFRSDVKAVVVGFDEYFSYTKLYKAASYLTDPSCHFVVPTCSGAGVIIGENRFQPLTGPIVSAVSMASRREPVLVGKPAGHMFDCIMAKHPEIQKSRCLMIGDSLKADVGFAKSIGINSALVLSGAYNFEAIHQLSNEAFHPEFFCNSLADLDF